MSDKAKQTAVHAIVGGSSGIGYALAAQLVRRGDSVLIGGRSAERLQSALGRLGSKAIGRTVDTSDKASLVAFFDGFSEIKSLFTPAASYRTGSFRDSEQETAEGLFEAKFWGQYHAVHAALPHLASDAAIVLMSGAASARPIGAPAYAACNSALEGLARGLAIELAPIRVNCVAPGTTDSELWRNRPAEVREPAFAAWSKLALVGRPATVDEIAASVLFLIDNGNMSGSTLFCDGGYTLR